MNPAVLVTGGAGYIGSHACKALAKAGYTPIAYDSLVNGHVSSVKWGPLIEGNILDRTCLDRAFAQYKPSAVMHFAAHAYVGESVTQPGKYYKNNVGGTLCLLEAMRDHGIERIVFSSSCATYGVPSVIPIPEHHPQIPINPYGASKLMAERMLADFEVAHGLKSITLRYFNAAGADPEGEIGEDHDPETHLIPLVLQAAAGKRSSVTIFGTDYETPDGTCIRDYIHVTDLADAHVLALRVLKAGVASAAYNLGNGRGYSVKEVIEAARRATRRDIPVHVGSRRPGDPPRLVGAAAKARSELGWQPRFGSLDTILQSAWSWHRLHWQSPAIFGSTETSLSYAPG